MTNAMVTVLVSVIIPTFNRSSVLDMCMRSILNQTVSVDTYEVIIVDDCSSDDTPEKCRHYAERYKNVRYLRNQVNQGLASTRNNGISAAEGKLLVFLDNDLIVESDFIYHHIRRHEALNFDRVAVVSNITYAPDFLKETNYGRFIQSRAIGYRKKSDMIGLDINNLPGNYFAGGGSSCSRENVIHNGLFNASLKKYGCEDELFGFHFVQNGGKVVFEPAAKLIHYDRNIGPDYWKRKYTEMGRYSLKEIFESERDYFLSSNYQYLVGPSLKTDTLKVFIIKLLIAFISAGIFRYPAEWYVMKTDRFKSMYCEPLYRYITAAWMRYGFSTQQPIEKVEY